MIRDQVVTPIIMLKAAYLSWCIIWNVLEIRIQAFYLWHGKRFWLLISCNHARRDNESMDLFAELMKGASSLARFQS